MKFTNDRKFSDNDNSLLQDIPKKESIKDFYFDLFTASIDSFWIYLDSVYL